ncbi:MAG: nitrogen regulation protein NR(I) [Pseudomonadota bacterium]|nr:nitrogen regulation protein NR(I) [Pseudomonadota bacterium]MEC9392298.1 nitrogen regulation protein NR(I) [Pseudomonadota bacterium]MEC9459359.1 nitrogen regulation protein NR(I) [Pseudomonadota bacterium]MED5436577.1 nitrogen regulation protein NR(I) [Pseudomonadota bacterium]|tara:strand:+ start:411 stop:1850 length:1440 start_codon:yes stop_codon:yes gene_type:complete
MTQKNIILAEDDDSIRLVTTRYLEDSGFNVLSATSLKDLWKLIESGAGEALVTDVMMPDGELFEILPQIIELRDNLPVIVISAKNNLQTAISATKQGAYEYLPKPFDLEELLSLVVNAIESRNVKREKVKSYQSGDKQLIIGRSPSMQDLYKSIARLSQNDLTVMIYGESGTGKELVAKALHQYGPRSDQPFIALNMAAIPSELIESELFGHEKGSFTGAHQKTDGKFKQAEKGTLFLDEIGDMPIEAQTRLLRVLQEGEFTSIGGKEKIKTDTRIIAATHKNLPLLIEKGIFREDLYYRLNVVPISIPSLRERKEDLVELVNHFLNKAESLKLSPKKIDTKGYKIIESYSWPGNVRELENFIYKLSALYTEDLLDTKILKKEIKILKDMDKKISDTAKGFLSLISNYFSKNISKISEDHSGEIYNHYINEVEKALLVEILKSKNGNQLRASEILGLNRNTLRKKITELNIDIDIEKSK